VVRLAAAENKKDEWWGSFLLQLHAAPSPLPFDGTSLERVLRKKVKQMLNR